MTFFVLVLTLLIGCGNDAGSGEPTPEGGRGGEGSRADAAGLEDASRVEPSDAGPDAAQPIACDDSLDCPIGAVCDARAHECVECTRDSDCGAAEVCVARSCRRECDSDIDCQPLRMLCDHAAGHCVNELAPSDAGMDGGGECTGSQVIALARVPPTVMLVIDGSGSMEEAYGQPALLDSGVPDPEVVVPSRWNALRDALVSPTDGIVPPLAGHIRFGLGVFGTMPQCPLPLGVVEPAIHNSDAIASALPSVPPGAFTPTGAALDAIIDQLPDSMIEPARGQQIIVLATDGDPNSCEGVPDVFMGGQVPTDYAPSLAAAAKANAKHIKLFVISVGQDASAAHLQEMANLGAGLAANADPGARVYTPEDAAELSSDLRDVIEGQLGCDLLVNLAGRAILEDKACSGQLTINGAVVPCDADAGWSFVAPATIRLASDACAALADSSASVAVSFPCDALAR